MGYFIPGELTLSSKMCIKAKFGPSSFDVFKTFELIHNAQITHLHGLRVFLHGLKDGCLVC